MQLNKNKKNPEKCSLEDSKGKYIKINKNNLRLKKEKRKTN